MPRFRRRRRMNRNPGVKLKNQHNFKASITVGPKNAYVLMAAIPPGAARVTGDQVPAGNHVYRYNLNLNAIHPTGSGSGNLDLYVAFLRAGQTTADLPDADWSAIGLSTLRNQIIWSELNQIGSEDAGPYKRKVSIPVPKLYQRVREGDQAVLIWGNSQTIEINYGVRFSSFS